MEPTDLKFTKEYIQGLLHDRSIKNLYITFTKADGTDRTMRCTLIEDHIPAEKKPKGTGRSTTDTTQRVFDLDIQEWRSFKLDSVKEVKFGVGSTNE